MENELITVELLSKDKSVCYPIPKAVLMPASAQCHTGTGHSQHYRHAWSQGTFQMLVK